MANKHAIIVVKIRTEDSSFADLELEIISISNLLKDWDEVVFEIDDCNCEECQKIVKEV